MGWIKTAIKDLKSSIDYMSKNNSDGTYDTALEKQKNALMKQNQNFRHFLTRVPAREEPAAHAA